MKNRKRNIRKYQLMKKVKMKMKNTMKIIIEIIKMKKIIKEMKTIIKEMKTTIKKIEVIKENRNIISDQDKI